MFQFFTLACWSIPQHDLDLVVGCWHMVLDLSCCSETQAPSNGWIKKIISIFKYDVDCIKISNVKRTKKSTNLFFLSFFFEIVYTC